VIVFALVVQLDPAICRQSQCCHPHSDPPTTVFRRSFSLKATTVVAFGLMCTALSAAEGIKSSEYGVPYLYQGLAVWAFVWGGLDAFGIGANDGEDSQLIPVTCSLASES